MAQERVVYLNGEMVPESGAKISVRDLGFVFGDAVFDVTRTFGGTIFRLEEHLERLYDSLAYLRIDPGMTRERMAGLTMQVLEANLPLLGENDDYWVAQRVTRGVPAESGPVPTVIIECMPLPFAERAAYYRDGLPLITPSVRRTPPQCMSPRVKMHNYINLVLGELEVQSQNPKAWPILLDMNGNLCEGKGSNIFIVKNERVTTPREQYVLAGISRQTVIKLARNLGIEVAETDIDLFDAYTAEEVFLTSTSFCICPVSSINGSVVGAGKVPGPVTGRLQKAYNDLVGIDIVEQYLARLT